MTPKDALNNIATISEILVEVSKSHIMSNKAIDEIRKLDIAEIYFTLRQAFNDPESIKKPPTVDEMIKALSEHEKANVFYSDKTHEFYYLEYEGKKGEYKQFIVETYGNNLWTLGVYLPPHLIVMIGRFYEGLEKGE